MSNKKTVPKVKEPIKLRFKNLSNGNKSIYLDYYNNGKREYEFLRKLYLIPETTPADKNANSETLRLANAVKAKKIVELQNTEHGFSAMTRRAKMNLIDYVKAFAEKKKGIVAGSEKGGNYKAYMALCYHLEQYKGNTTTFRQVDREFCTGFIEYLKTANQHPKKSKTKYSKNTLCENTQFTYIVKFTSVLNEAISDGIINGNPIKQIKPENKPKKQTAEIEYLTIDEVKKLVDTPCIKPIVKQAFLFACFSGLRYSDVKALQWSDIHTDSEGQKLIRYTQQKTKKYEYLQVSNEALKFLPDRNNAKSDDIIFPLYANGYVNTVLAGWILSAGIKKRVTFHVGRHTNATLLLSLGVPIETVSKLLGHADIQTTRIYAKVIDKNKRAAVSKLDGLTD